MNTRSALPVMLFISMLLFGCGKTGTLSLSDSLTTFITAEKILEEEDNRRLIHNPTGNFLRDAIRILNSDQRTKGYYKNLSLITQSVSKDNSSYTFAGTVAGTINDIPTNTTQQVIVTLAQEQEEIYYELNFGANP